MCAVAHIAAAAECVVPEPFAIAVEERDGGDGAGRALVATAGDEGSGLAAGDIVRQANGARVQSCADLQRAATDARARDLVLLLGIERDGRLLALVAGAPAETPALAAVPAPETVAPARNASEPPRPAQAPAARRAPAVTPPRREVALPARADASGALVGRADAAAAALANVDATASTSLPLSVYERRLGEAEAAIAVLAFGVDDADTAVRDYVEEVLALHRTARGIRRAQLRVLADARIDRRGPSAATLPYFSDSDVPQWVGAYPFLQVTILNPPRATRFPVPGETAGRWDAERALGLLWERASAGRTALASWAGGG